MEHTPYVSPENHESDPEDQAIPAKYQATPAKCERPWWQSTVAMIVGGAVAGTLVGAAAMSVIGPDTGTSSGSSNAPSTSPRSQQPQSVQPAGLTYQQKSQILSTFCTSSPMRGPAGDSSAFPTCMASYYVTDQGMVMPK